MIPALSIRQPWAWLIVTGQKTIENRTWRTDYRGPLLIHASKRRVHVPGISAPDDLPAGGIVGVATIIDVATAPDALDPADLAWFEGPYGFVLRFAKERRLRRCKGQLGLFYPNR